MKSLTYTLYLICISLSLSGCKKSLDLKNTGAFDPASVWNDPQLANAYLTNLYATTLPSGWPVNSGGNADELSGNLPEGAVSTNNALFKSWPYDLIRNINILLTEIDKGTLPAGTKEKMKGQAYFLRAWVYFNVVKLYGGVPILEQPLGVKDDLSAGRNSTKACFDFIEADLNKAINALPNQYIGGDRGRIDKAASLAFLGRVMLYKASPQFHPSNPYGNTDWPKAYEANKMAKVQLAGMGFGLNPDYAAIWAKNNKGNKEAVMSVLFMAPNRMNGRLENQCRPLSESIDASGGDQPVWEMVAAYPMKDGLQPGISLKYPYDLQTFWKDRDPRFYASVVYNGSIYELSRIAGRRQYTANGVASIDDVFGGGEQGDFHRTGFFPRKGMDPGLLKSEVTKNETDWIEIRYAEVLLNFAEAANETGKSNEALEALIQIRKRAGIEAGADQLYGLGGSIGTAEIRDAIYFERRIEFIYEGQRFNELRRTRRLNEIDGMRKNGLLATLKSDKAAEDGKTFKLLPEDFTYKIQPLFSNGTNLMSAPERYYFFPIPRVEIEKNPKLLQNKGWDGGTFDPTLE